MSKKKLIAVLTLVCFMFTFIPVAAMADTQDTVILKIGSTDVYKNGTKITTDVPPVIVDGRTLVPVRVVIEALGGDVDWDETTRTVIISIDGKVLKLVIDKEIPGYGTGAMIVDGRTMVPIRYISEYVGYEVKWIEATQQVIITRITGEAETTYTVSFDLNTGSEGVYKTVTVEEGKTVEKPTVEYKSGRVFHGWYTNDEGKGDVFDFSTPIYSDLTLYGHWSTVSYGGGSGFSGHTHDYKIVSNGNGTHSYKCSCGDEETTEICEFDGEKAVCECGANLDEISGADAIHVKSAEALQKALAKGGNIVLKDDITVTATEQGDADRASVYVLGLAVIDKDVVLNLNGNDITVAEGDDATAAIFVLDGTLTITGEGTITSPNENSYIVWAKGASEVNIYSGTYQNLGESAWLYASGITAWDPNDDWATINVYGGTFNTEKSYGQILNVMNHGVGRINLYGGYFENFNPASDVSFDDKKYVKVADGYKVEEKSPYYEIVKNTVSTADALVEELENGNDVVLTTDVKIDPASMSNAYGTTGINVKNGQTIDGGGNTLDIKGAGGTWDSGINTTGGLIKNITVTGSFRGIFINHNSEYSERVVLENVIIDGTTYTISCDQGMNQGLTATGSTFNGWTSYAATLGDAKFVDCDFGEGKGYAYCRPYAPTEFVDCDFEAGFEMDTRAAVTFENCRIGGVALTADNLATLVTSNIANATVK